MSCQFVGRRYPILLGMFSRKFLRIHPWEALRSGMNEIVQKSDVFLKRMANDLCRKMNVQFADGQDSTQAVLINIHRRLQKDPSLIKELENEKVLFSYCKVSLRRQLLSFCAKKSPNFFEIESACDLVSRFVSESAYQKLANQWPEFAALTIREFAARHSVSYRTAHRKFHEVKTTIKGS